jgi:hypothetical protein
MLVIFSGMAPSCDKLSLPESGAISCCWADYQAMMTIALRSKNGTDRVFSLPGVT